MKHEQFPDVLEDIMNGKIELPNFEEKKLSAGVSSIAAGANLQAIMNVRRARMPGSERGQWARFFLSGTQSGTRDGTGLVMIWGSAGGTIGRFAICQHEKVVGEGADSLRGWHPGRCSKCGLDMTVDSGD